MEHIILLLKILMINLVLSGDNAVVIAMASKNLPEKQRSQAIWWGAIGAVGLRCVLTFVAVLLLRIPFIQAAGGLLLLWIAFKLLYDNEDHVGIRAETSIWKAIQVILVADFVMSLDNVLAIAALANGDIAIIVIGIAISIPIVVWGSNIIAIWLHRVPVLVLLGSAILAFTAGEMLLRDSRLGVWLASAGEVLHAGLPGLLAAVVIVVGTYRQLRARHI
ncbi:MULTISPECIES: TerC family protein [Paenibacillus]|uniref:YjbE family integral membrane protein n=1 Tax=Paenibacillus brasilensis TaxID=128574 RepID=A0ABU0KUH0_9BACL|nr:MULTISPECIES: TerC family protein [Paenibacillus]MDQ0493082.1 YjbE family integral membrane protein [Paenibacillus brasilensis]